MTFCWNLLGTAQWAAKTNTGSVENGKRGWKAARGVRAPSSWTALTLQAIQLCE